jgi:hypothetical protein
MVQPRGVEPRSDALQAPAMTASAKVAKLVLLPRIELGIQLYQSCGMPFTYSSKTGTSKRVRTADLLLVRELLYH